MKRARFRREKPVPPVPRTVVLAQKDATKTRFRDVTDVRANPVSVTFNQSVAQTPGPRTAPRCVTMPADNPVMGVIPAPSLAAVGAHAKSAYVIFPHLVAMKSGRQHALLCAQAPVIANASTPAETASAIRWQEKIA